MRNTLCTIALASVLIPAAAVAQTSAGAETTTSARAGVTAPGSVNAAADAKAEARIRASIDKAAEAGVPRAVLENKVAEGRAKGASAARIAAAVEHRAEVLARVSAAIRGETSTDEAPVTDAELTAAADAFENGVGIGQIVSLTAKSGENRALALTVLAELVARGNVAPSNALVRVQTALNGGAAALRQLGVNGAAATDAGINVPPVKGAVTGATGVKIGN